MSFSKVSHFGRFNLRNRRCCDEYSGSTIGKVAIIPDEFPEYNCNQAIALFRPVKKGLSSYLYLYLLAGKFLEQIELIGTAGQDNISVTKSRSIIIPLPPVPEQNRIIEKSTQLMALCNTLEHHIDQATQKQTALLNALTANHAKIHNHHP